MKEHVEGGSEMKEAGGSTPGPSTEAHVSAQPRASAGTPFSALETPWTS